MPLIYGGTVVQNIIYNGTTLTKVYYKQGTNDPVLVFATPTIYNGGSGTALFGQKSFVYYLQRASTYMNNSNFSTFDSNTMYGTVTRSTSGSSYHYGVCVIVGSETFDISQYSTLTFTYDVTASTSNASLGVSITCGLSTQCERAGSDQSSWTYYQLGGTQYSTSITGRLQGTNQTQTLNLTNAKANGSQYYPYISFAPQNLNYSLNETWGVQIKSIILS